MKIDKQHLLKRSKVFCMFPWLHLNVTPTGNAYPCCSNAYTKPWGNVKEQSLEDIFHSPRMNQLRKAMLDDEPSDICKFCYRHEQASPHSFRTYGIEQFGHRFDELVPQTEEDGSVKEFRMHYFDIRFSNLCNFKCRTCGAEFSSQWASEYRQQDGKHPVLLHADDQQGSLLSEVLKHVDHIDLAYFAGGEPLITDEHYLLLEEMIRRGRTDITLRYNTNASHVSHKKHDIVDLWRRFRKIELQCSIDHVGEKAEWLRHGTDWGMVERNLKLFRNLGHVEFSINTVLSLFNWVTLDQVYGYLHQQDIVRADDWKHNLYLALNPPYYCAQNMPHPLKSLGKQRALAFMRSHEHLPKVCEMMTAACEFVDQGDLWSQTRPEFTRLTANLDGLRGEDFLRVFPELAPLMEAANG